jgi:hypothetical protein
MGSNELEVEQSLKIGARHKVIARCGVSLSPPAPSQSSLPSSAQSNLDSLTLFALCLLSKSVE